MGDVLKKLLIFVAGNLIVFGGIQAIENHLNGKDIFGREKEKKVPKDTTMDWKGNIILGSNDYNVE